MGIVVPISNTPSPFGELEPGSTGQGGPSEANLLMALSTMHKQGRFNQNDDDDDDDSTSKSRRRKST